MEITCGVCGGQVVPERSVRWPVVGCLLVLFWPLVPFYILYAWPRNRCPDCGSNVYHRPA